MNSSDMRAIGGYDNRRDSVHLPPRNLGLAPDQVQYKHDKRCCMPIDRSAESGAMASSVPVAIPDERDSADAWHLGGREGVTST